MSEEVETPDSTRERVKDIVNQLLDRAKMTPIDIAQALQNRVSSRTVYRWAKGESTPGNSYDLSALEELYDERLK